VALQASGREDQPLCTDVIETLGDDPQRIVDFRAIFTTTVFTVGLAF